MNIEFDSVFDATKVLERWRKRIAGGQNHSRQRFKIFFSYSVLSCRIKN